MYGLKSYVDNVYVEKMKNTLYVGAQGFIPTPAHEVVMWYDEEPRNHVINAFFELRKPVKVPTIAVETPYELKKKLRKLKPGSYDEIRFYASGKFFAKRALEEPFQVTAEMVDEIDTVSKKEGYQNLRF